MGLKGRKILRFCILVAIIPLAASVDINKCRKDIIQLLSNKTLSLQDPRLKLGEDGRTPVSITEAGCSDFCGPGITWYQDIGPRLSQWIIPAIILVTNMEVSPLDKRRYFTVIHLLGDPIHSLWSLLAKVQAWSNFYDLPPEALHGLGPSDINRRVLGTLLGAMEELTAPGTMPTDALRQLLRGADCSEESLKQLMNETALELASNRTENILRTCLAVILYIFQVVSSFVAAIGGGNTSPPAGRVSTAISLTWTIPIILLSNAIGVFPSRHSCFLIMQRFASRIPRSASSEHYESDISPALGYGDSTKYFKDQWRHGTIYTNRPLKALSASTAEKTSLRCLMLAVFPIFLSTGILAQVISWYNPPNAFGCRGFMLLAFILVYILSAFTTWRTSGKKGKYWYFMLVKDITTALFTLVLVFVSTAGLFNTCWCRSNIITLHNKSYVLLDNAAYLEKKDLTLFPALFYTSLGLQIITFFVMVWLGRKGLGLMRWCKCHKREIGRVVSANFTAVFKDDKDQSKCCKCWIRSHFKSSPQGNTTSIEMNGRHPASPTP